MSEKLMDTKMWALVAAIIVVTSGLIVIGAETQNLASKSPGKITVTDSLGRTFTFNHTLTRIVSLDPSATATLYAIGAYKDMVGGNEFDCYPPNESLPNVGDAFSVNYEALLNLSPQLVLGYGSSMPTYGTYINNTLHIPFMLDNPESFQQIENETMMLGTLTGTQSNASLVVSWMQQNIASINSTTSALPGNNQSIFYYNCNIGGIWTAGTGTFINQFFTTVHVRNIVKQPGFRTISQECIANASPSIILLDQYVPVSAVNCAPFNQTAAMTSSPQRVYTMFNDNFFVDPDFRVVFGIQWLAQEIYPAVQLQLSPFPLNLQYYPGPTA